MTHALQVLHTLQWNHSKAGSDPVGIFGSLGLCIYVPASRHWLISYSPIHLT